ncbi:MAG: ATP-grasp fold amidoligase family protein [Candidatus Halalkalibacterium sp. M3_1C_030]
MKFILSKIFWGFLRHLLSDKQYALYRYWLELDEWPDLENPQTFTEKIQYIKLYQRNELRERVADRIKVRTYVADKIGKDHLIPLLGNFQEITRDVWQELPNQFVLKANHGCGMLEIVRDKNQADYDEIYRNTENWKETDYSKIGREWVYEGLPRTILAEKLLLDSGNSIPVDYKFFCFHGSVKIIQIDFDRFSDQRRNLYDREFNRLDARLLYPNYDKPVEKPDKLDKAIEISELLSADFNFIRVDLYLMENNIYFGELTNYPGNGFVPFEPESMNYKIGKLLRL